MSDVRIFEDQEWVPYFTRAQLERDLAAERARADAAESVDSLKTREINILTAENRALLAELAALRAYVADLERLADIAVQFDDRAKTLAEIRKRHAMQAAP